MHLAKESAAKLFFEYQSWAFAPNTGFRIRWSSQRLRPKFVSKVSSEQTGAKLFGEEELRDHIHIDDVAKLGVEMIQRQFSGAAMQLVVNCLAFIKSQIHKKVFQ